MARTIATIQKSLGARFRQQNWEREIRDWQWPQEVQTFSRKQPSSDAWIQSIESSIKGSKAPVSLLPLSECSPAYRHRLLHFWAELNTQRKIDLWQQSLTRTNIVLHVDGSNFESVEIPRSDNPIGPNIFIVVAPQANIRILRPKNTTKSWTSESVFILAEPHSQIEYIDNAISSGSGQSFLQVLGEKDSRTTVVRTSQAHQLQHATASMKLNSKGAEGRLYVWHDGRGHSRSLSHLSLHHQSSNTYGRIHFAGLGQDQSRTDVPGMIITDLGARVTESALREDVLLLSSESAVETEPNLEISAHEVQVAHSATVGHLSPALMYYLTSRGLRPEEARQLLVRGFVHRFIDAVDAGPQTRREVADIISTLYGFRKN
ncbi:MAG: SufD family Fe-S cluster assembly protein [bacterium]|nr:SufD family Fe-S cluster assembly protein [bacterium]